MATFSGEGWGGEVVEWWDSNGKYHANHDWEGPRGGTHKAETFTERDAANAFQVTVRTEDDQGRVRHTTLFSGDSYDNAQGWDYDELWAEIDDWFIEGSP